MRAMEILLEGPEDILKSFFSLTKGDGKFKSEKQRDFLLSQCNAGEGIFRLGQRLHFGAHGGASANVDWIVVCDNEGVKKITKSTGAKGESVYWERTPEQMAKQAAKAKLHKEEMVRHYKERVGMYQKDVADAEEQVTQSKEKYERISALRDSIVSSVGEEEADALLGRLYSSYEQAVGRLQGCKAELEKEEANLHASEQALK